MDLYSNRNNFLRVFNRSQRQWEIKFGRKFQKLRKSRDGQWKTRVNGGKNQAANLTAHCTKKKKKNTETVTEKLMYTILVWYPVKI